MAEFSVYFYALFVSWFPIKIITGKKRRAMALVMRTSWTQIFFQKWPTSTPLDAPYPLDLMSCLTFCNGITWEQMHLESCKFLWCLIRKNWLRIAFFPGMTTPTPPPNHPQGPPKSPQNTNFANYGPIWMKLVVEVDNK